MKRFTETCKWDDPWFRGLTGVQKLVFLYVIDRCNNAGFWEVDQDSMAFHTKLKPELISAAWQGLTRGLIGADGWVWVRRFLRHQKNEDLNPENNAHKQIIALISEQVDRFSIIPEFASFLAPQQPLYRGLGKGLVEVKDSEGSVEGRPKKDRATQEEIDEFFQGRELPASDAEWFFEKCNGNGWTNNGKPIRDWRSTVRAWQAANYLPSQKINGNPPKPNTAGGMFLRPVSAPTR